ncbi:hypothetical protein PYCC9005_005458 [Savitreella phatthalungensis]
MADMADMATAIADVTLGDDNYTLAQKICYLTGVDQGGNEYDGSFGVRLSALFVILVTSSATTFFPVLARRVRWLRINLWVYLFARYFGAGVIVATAFIHLLDPAYSAIGPNTCVGVTAGWDEYSWVPGIVLTTVVVLFLIDFSARLFVEKKYGLTENHDSHNPEALITRQADGTHTHLGHIHGGDHELGNLTSSSDGAAFTAGETAALSNGKRGYGADSPIVKAKDSLSDDEDSMAPLEEKMSEEALEQSYLRQITAFYILEFGVVFHSVIIGLNLAVAGYDDFKTLYVVLVFHQGFEGLGVGARLSAIPFPRRVSYVPWLLCAAYGLCTPIAIAIGLGLRTTYAPDSFTAQVVSGLFDSVSAGILIYTGLVELLAADFIFNPHRTKDTKRIVFMLGCVILGALLMALLGKWA